MDTRYKNLLNKPTKDGIRLKEKPKPKELPDTLKDLINRNASKGQNPNAVK